MSLLERIYFFHQELERNRFPNATSLVDQFEVSLATARRDIAYLRDRLLAPLEFSHDRNGFYYTEEGFRLPFEQTPKIVFFLGMLSKVAEEAGLGTLPEVASLEEKLSKMVLPEYSSLVNTIHCEWVEVEEIEQSTFDAIVEATAKKRILEIDYRSAKAEESKRETEPLRLINYQGRWYLLAHCRLRQGIRLFHIARIKSAALSRESFTPRKNEEELRTYLGSAFGIFKGEPLFTATIRFSSTAAELVRQQRWHKDQRIEEQDGAIIMHLPVNDERELMMKILQYGAMAEVLYPAKLRQRIQQEILDTCDLYKD